MNCLIIRLVTEVRGVVISLMTHKRSRRVEVVEVTRDIALFILKVLK